MNPLLSDDEIIKKNKEGNRRNMGQNINESTRVGLLVSTIQYATCSMYSDVMCRQRMTLQVKCTLFIFIVDQQVTA